MLIYLTLQVLESTVIYNSKVFVRFCSFSVVNMLRKQELKCDKRREGGKNRIFENIRRRMGKRKIGRGCGKERACGSRVRWINANLFYNRFGMTEFENV